MKKLHPAIWIIPSIALFVAIFPLPYGYYTLLRILVTICAVVIAYRTYSVNEKVSAGVIVFAGISLIFNPIIPIHFSKELWLPIDIISGCIFLIGYWKNKRLVRLTDK